MTKGWKLKALVAALTFATTSVLQAQDQASAWPPKLPGMDGTATLQTEAFLQVPSAVQKIMAEGCDPKAHPKPYTDKPAPFVVAKVPPRVEIALHKQLPHDGRSSTGWSSWGDIGTAPDGRVYSGIGDHADELDGANAYIYEWDPKTSTLRQVVDVNAVGPREGGEPRWSKVHARVSPAPDGWVYFTGTLGDGQETIQERFASRWTKSLPGGQLLRYNPVTGKSEVFANLPAPMATATSRMDWKRNRWWCNLEGGRTKEGKYRGDAMYAIDLATGKEVFRSAAGVVGMNRDFALAADGDAIFNGTVPGEIWRADVETGTIVKLNAKLPAPLRGTTEESSDGYIYGVCGVKYGPAPRPGELFRYHVANDTVELYGPEWLCGEYTPIVLLSPDERFLYYMPGAHGQARDTGTPVIQYHIASGTRKVLAFLREPIEQAHHFTPAGTYGVSLSPDGKTIYANLNCHAAAQYRPPQLKDVGFGLTAFVAIHIPEEELKDPAAAP